jgi:O-antigen ligase
MARRDLRLPAQSNPRHSQIWNSPALAGGPAVEGAPDEEPAAFHIAEQFRRIALGLTAALIVARAFWPSEPDLREGAGEGMSWVLVLLIVAGLAVAAPLIGGSIRFRWSWTDAFVVLLTIVVAASASHALDRRPAINLAWEWLALGITYLLLRSLPRSRSESWILVGALVATAMAVSVYGLYQARVELPLLQAEFQRDPRQMLQKLNIEPGTRGELVLKNRLVSSNEPWSTFALANSLAGFIVGPFVVAVAVAFRSLLKSDRPATRLAATALAAPVLLVLLVCLMATKSRSAWLGAAVGLGVVAWRARRQVAPRVLLFTGISTAGIIAILVAVGLAMGQLDRLVATQSGKSLRYRWEYWQGAWGVLSGGSSTFRDAARAPTFWWGVGPGNFGGPYLRYKLPEASEEILDPHNLFLEVWSTGGLWALVALVAALGFGFWSLLGPPSRLRLLAEPDRANRRSLRGQAALAPELDHEPGSRKQEPDDSLRSARWLIAWAAAGWVVVVLLGRLNPFQGDLFYRWLILGAGWTAAVFLGAPLWSRPSVAPAAMGAGALAVVVNLLAAGGIGIPTVALGLWSLVALGLNLRDDRACSVLHEYNTRLPAFVLAMVWAAVLGTFAGDIGPFWQSEAYMAHADQAVAHRPPSYDGALAACLSASQSDRYSPRPLLKLASLYWLIWRERGAKVEDQRWKLIPRLYNEAVATPRNPAAWSLHAQRATVILQLLSIVGDKLDPPEVLRYRGQVVEATRTAARLHPTSAELHARLAEASAEISMFKDAADEAERALELDRILAPHPDKRLSESVRDRLTARLPRWKESAARMPMNKTL